MNAIDSMLMSMLAATQATASTPPAAKPGGGAAQEDGPSFKDLLQDKQQGQAAPADKSEATPEDKAAQDSGGKEELQLPGTPQQELAAALIAQNIVVMPQAQQAGAAETMEPVQTVETVLPQAAQTDPRQTAEQALPEAQAEPVDQTAPAPVKDPVGTGQGAAEAPADAPAQTATDTVQRPQGTEERSGAEQKPLDTAARPRSGREEVQAPADGAQQQAQPLFHDVERAPVKVGDAQALDTAAPDMDAQLAGKVDQALDEGARRVEIRLTPENLGTVVVEMTQRSDGTLHVVLHATSDKAANLLTEHAANLGSLLQSGNQGPVQVEVQRQQENQQSQQQRYQDQQQQGGGRQQENHQQEHRRQDAAQDFMHQLRLGLVTLED